MSDVDSCGQCGNYVSPEKGKVCLDENNKGQIVCDRCYGLDNIAPRGVRGSNEGQLVLQEGYKAK